MFFTSKYGLSLHTRPKKNYIVRKIRTIALKNNSYYCSLIMIIWILYKSFTDIILFPLFFPPFACDVWWEFHKQRVVIILLTACRQGLVAAEWLKRHFHVGVRMWRQQWHFYRGAESGGGRRARRRGRRGGTEDAHKTSTNLWRQDKGLQKSDVLRNVLVLIDRKSVV